MTTGTVLVTDALRQIGIVGQSVAAAPTNALNIGLRALNRMLGSWANVRTMLYTLPLESFPFVASQPDYTTDVIFADGRPTALNYMNVELSSVIYPCELIVNQTFADIGYPPATGIPEVCYYDAAFPDGTLTFFPIPYSSAISCNVYTQRPLTGAIVAATDVLLPDGYEKAIVDNLALYAATMFPGAPVSALLNSEAKEGRRVLKVTNYTALVSTIGWNRAWGPPTQWLPDW